MPVFTLTKGDSPLVVSMPHSGAQLVPGMSQRLTTKSGELPDTDWHIPRLYGFLPELGASVLRANYSRYVVDLNRDPSGQSLYPGQVSTGLVPTELFDGSPIYRDGHGLGEGEAEQRRETYFHPYHEALEQLLYETREVHGFALLWDAHSIASQVPRLFEGRLPDLNLGSNSGLSCAPEIQAAAEAILADQAEFTSVSNGRFKGGWITRNYGRPDHHVHALQMEIAQIAYMSEAPGFQFDEVKAQRLRPLLQSIITAALSAAQLLSTGDRS